MVFIICNVLRTIKHYSLRNTSVGIQCMYQQKRKLSTFSSESVFYPSCAISLSIIPKNFTLEWSRQKGQETLVETNHSSFYPVPKGNRTTWLSSWENQTLSGFRMTWRRQWNFVWLKDFFVIDGIFYHFFASNDPQFELVWRQDVVFIFISSKYYGSK